jgi:hypothetical protein
MTDLAWRLANGSQFGAIFYPPVLTANGAAYDDIAAQAAFVVIPEDNRKSTIGGVSNQDQFLLWRNRLRALNPNLPIFAYFEPFTHHVLIQPASPTSARGAANDSFRDWKDAYIAANSGITYLSPVNGLTYQVAPFMARDYAGGDGTYPTYNGSSEPARFFFDVRLSAWKDAVLAAVAQLQADTTFDGVFFDNCLVNSAWYTNNPTGAPALARLADGEAAIQTMLTALRTQVGPNWGILGNTPRNHWTGLNGTMYESSAALEPDFVTTGGTPPTIADQVARYSGQQDPRISLFTRNFPSGTVYDAALQATIAAEFEAIRALGGHYSMGINGYGALYLPPAIQAHITARNKATPLGPMYLVFSTAAVLTTFAAAWPSGIAGMKFVSPAVLAATNGSTTRRALKFWPTSAQADAIRLQVDGTTQQLLKDLPLDW